MKILEIGEYRKEGPVDMVSSKDSKPYSYAS